MNDTDKEGATPRAKTISIGPLIAASGRFTLLYSDGMALIEAVATYLDTEGREASRVLAREASFIYATESMRLTTRLMQLASWLLLQRAANEGEITPEHARIEKEKVKFAPTPEQRGGPGYQDLPDRLTAFIAEGDRLLARVQQFDALERGQIARPAPEAGVGSIGDQLSRLRAAFEQLSG